MIAVSSTAPAYSIATSLGALAAAVALAGPAAIWVGFIPITGIAVAYYYMNRADPNCGAAYTWSSKALHPSIALIYSYLRRHPKYMSMPTESAPSNALS